MAIDAADSAAAATRPRAASRAFALTGEAAGLDLRFFLFLDAAAAPCECGGATTLHASARAKTAVNPRRIT